MLRKSFLILAVLCAALLIGCSSTNNNNNSTAAEGNRNTGVTAPSTPTTTTSSSTTSGEKIGIAECDDFLAKYEDCVSGKVPEAQRAQYKKMLKDWRDAWRKAAENPMTKGTLATICKQASDSAKTSMKSYNCDF